MQNKTDNAIVVISSLAMLTGMILTPLAGIWPVASVVGGLWLAGKCGDIVHKHTRNL